MLVKVFESHEMSTALKMVKETLGPNALILSTRTIRKGGLGVFGRPVLEVTAAVDTPASEADFQQPARGAVAAGRRPNKPAEPDEIRYRDLWTSRGEDYEAPGEDSAGAALRAEDLAPLRQELAELKALIRQTEKPVAACAPTREEPSPTAGKAGYLKSFQADLAQTGLAAEIVARLVHRADEELTSRQLRSARSRREFFGRLAAELVQVTGPIPTSADQQQRIALIGPTGVGKTTTLAKLAADYLERSTGKVALVTIDTYRIAAAEQLRIYGDIMNLPVEVVFTPDQLQSAFARHADKDLILIDTAGRSHRDEPRMEELAAFLGPETGTRNHLVLAAPTRERELEETVRRFGLLPLDSLIFTKLDECGELGSLLNIPIRRQLPISYLTNGQRVPEDLLNARPEMLADLILEQ
jgi:flagellar biosynthesis protein FlhF